VAAGADGLEIEVHIDPSVALSDKEQQLTPDAFKILMRRVNELREFMPSAAMGEGLQAARGDGQEKEKASRPLRPPTRPRPRSPPREPLPRENPFTDAMD